MSEKPLYLNKWRRLAEAAEILSTTPAALRARIGRVGGGRDDVTIDGVRFRRFGRLWKVQFDAAWAAPATA